MKHPLFARVYVLLSAKSDPRAKAQREEMLAGLTGRVIEVGAGNGLNFALYPPGVTEVVAVEPEPYLRSKGEEAAARATTTIRVVEGHAEALPAADDEFDAAVTSLVLCSVPSQERALAEVKRALRPGGELRVYEHVLSSDPKKARSQHRITKVFPRVSGGCHPNRDTPAAIEAAGFEWDTLRRFDFKPGPGLGMVEPHVIGVARKPAA